MIELIVLEYLSEVLEAPVYLEKPKKAENAYVLIEKTGSGKENHLRSAVLAVQSYAGSMYQAACLNEQVKEAMDLIVELPEIARTSLDSDYNFTDTTTKEYRYQAVFRLVHY